MARIDNIHTFGWYGTFERDGDGKCVPCESLSLYEDDGELKEWVKGIVQIEQYRPVTRIAWTAAVDKTDRDNYAANYGPGGKLADLPDELKPDLLTILKILHLLRIIFDM